MAVNRDKGHKPVPPAQRTPARRTQAERSALTRAALLGAARSLFAERGYSGAGREEIAERAGMTRGALYHHFAGKQELFVAVVEELHAEVGARVAGAAMAAGGGDPREQLRVGCQAYLDAAMDPAVRRILLLDAPAVLGWEAWREIEARHGLGLVQEALAAVLPGVGSLDALARMLLAALNEAAMLVAEARRPRVARREVGATVDRLIARL
ncbi:MAG TPA: helix-turn-helix domain-containing protein [Acidimicrobiales bacterium]|nr:helix-turn-helix domain-containing protein [Acidimicrobiales bacterium]